MGEIDDALCGVRHRLYQPLQLRVDRKVGPRRHVGHHLVHLVAQAPDLEPLHLDLAVDADARPLVSPRASDPSSLSCASEINGPG